MTTPNEVDNFLSNNPFGRYVYKPYFCKIFINIKFKNNERMKVMSTRQIDSFKSLDEETQYFLNDWDPSLLEQLEDLNEGFRDETKVLH
ncbi:MAG: hypothetical protein CMK38_06990 [Porticoccaceae bacterium]|nr:hypothetical protein [Porticoccaceae bacterium]